MPTDFQTEQEAFWAGDFGDAYTDRNAQSLIAARTAILAKVLARTRGVKSVLELGANVGLNLQVIRQLLPSCGLNAVEINPKAVEALQRLPEINVHAGSILEQKEETLGKHDLTLISGVLIHINPDRLPQVYDLLHRCSTKYVCMIEYYNPTPVEISYRGHEGRLFKRDFAGEFMDRHGAELIDYGFQYHRDPNFPADDSTWFLMRRK